MEKLHFTIKINAPTQKVWESMLNDETYRKWTSAFHEGSCYRGEWKTGSEMLFLNNKDENTANGMYAIIKEARPYEFISIRHLGEIINGEKKIWEQYSDVEALENYTFNDLGNDVTELIVECDTEKSWTDMFNDMWNKALPLLKEIAEN